MSPEPEPGTGPPAGEVFRAAAVEQLRPDAGRRRRPPAFEDRTARRAFWGVAAVPLLAAGAAFSIRIDERVSGPVRFDTGRAGQFTLLVGPAPAGLAGSAGGLEASHLELAGRHERVADLAVAPADPSELQQAGFGDVGTPAVLITGRLLGPGPATAHDRDRGVLVLGSERLLVLLARPLFGGADEP